MLKSLKQLQTELISHNPWWEYRKDSYLRPDDSEGEYYYIRTPGSAMIIPITGEGKIVCVKQFRYLNGKESLEFIGGGIKQGLSAEQSAMEELLEEAGIIPGNLVKIGEHNPMNGVTDEICNIFVAASLKRNSPQPEVSEEFEVMELDYTKFCELIKDGIIWDGMTLAAFALFERHKEDFIITTTE
jgi:ADP-ribose pyrophosphatase